MKVKRKWNWEKWIFCRLLGKKIEFVFFFSFIRYLGYYTSYSVYRTQTHEIVILFLILLNKIHLKVSVDSCFIIQFILGHQSIQPHWVSEERRKLACLFDAWVSYCESETENISKRLILHSLFAADNFILVTYCFIFITCFYLLTVACCVQKAFSFK